MDTGFGDLLDPGQREAVLDVTRRVLGDGVPFYAGAYASADDGTAAAYADALAAIAARGARPVIVLTKSDLEDDVAGAVAAVESVAFGAPVLALSSVTGEGLDELQAHLGPGVTAALLGSSGVGKSTLVNTLAGEELLSTQGLRADGKGRHTTTRRELVQLPDGTLVIDTPGMREVQLWVADDGLEEAFEDVTELFGQCRFTDCAHESEPGCAVKEALANGTLPPERWESYLKLQRELAHLERRLDKRAASEERKRWKALSSFAREAGRAKGRR